MQLQDCRVSGAFHHTSAIALVTPAVQPPPTWKRAMARMVGETVVVSLAFRNGRGSYTERGSATVVVSDSTAHELAEAARECVRADGVRSGDYALSICRDGGKVKRIDPVRIRNDEFDCEESEPATTGPDPRDAVITVLTKENAELRAQLRETNGQMLDIQLKYGQLVINQANARTVEQALHSASLERRECAREAVLAASPDSDDSAVADVWWNSEACCTMISDGVKNLSELGGCIAAGLAGFKVPV